MRYTLQIGKTKGHQNEYGQYWREAHGKVYVDDQLLAVYSLVLDGVGCLHQIGVKTYLESYNSICLMAARVMSFEDGGIGYNVIDLSLAADSEDRVLSRGEALALPEAEQECLWEIFADIVANDPRIGSIRKQATIQ